MENVYGQYRRELNAGKNALKRVRPVPAGTQQEQKRLETCTASTGGYLHLAAAALTGYQYRGIVLLNRRGKSIFALHILQQWIKQ